MFTSLVILAAGLALLTAGAEVLVRGASRLAGSLGISALVVGLTVVAYGTSAPEMFVSVAAGLNGQSDLAVGNVVGSNIFNVLFILGLSALIVPLVISRQLIRLDVPIMVGVSILAFVLGYNGIVGRLEGAVLLGGMVLYTIWLVYLGKNNGTPDQAAPAERPPFRIVDLVYIAVGLVLLVIGSRMLVTSAIAIATALGVSELIIGLTIVAAGTSLPEVATSVVASIRGERDIAVGNVVGSNIFNILGVLGLTAVVSSGGIVVPASAVNFDIPIMAAVALACLPIFFTGHLIARWEGGVFLAYYVAYSVFLVLMHTQHDALPVFSAAMLWFALPITGITLAILAARSFAR